MERIVDITRSSLLVWVLILCGCSWLKPEGESPTSDTPAKEITAQALWVRKIGDAHKHLHLRPSVHNNVIYVCNSKGDVAALNAGEDTFDSTGNKINSGDILWHRDIDLPITGGIEANHQLAVVGTLDGEVIALSSKNGEPLWRTTVSSEILAPPKISGPIVLVRTIDGKLFALSSQDGRRLWVYERTVPALTLRGTSAPIIVGDQAIVGLDSGLLLALTLQDGHLLWENPLHQPRGKIELERLVDIDVEPVVSNSTIYAVTFQGQLAAIDLYSGRTKWSRQLSSLTGLATDSSRGVYVTDNESKLWGINSDTGDLLWEQDSLMYRQLTGPTVWGRYLIVGDTQGYVHILDRYDGAIALQILITKGFSIITNIEGLPTLTTGSKGFSLAPIKSDQQLLMYDRAGLLIAIPLGQITPTLSP